MLDLTTDKGRLISAALGLAAEKPWAQVTLADIAERGGATLVALKAQFASKGDVIAAFTTLVDDEMLRRAPRRAESQSARDALFEVIMSRFDVLEPFKGALKSIAGSGLPEPQQIGRLLSTQGWMLEAAGINSGGIDGGMRTAGLATIYASVFRVWLDDEDAGLAKTMAALDRRLRRGQRTLERVDDVCKGVERFASGIIGIVRGGFGAAKPSAPPTAASPAPSPGPGV